MKATIFAAGAALLATALVPAQVPARAAAPDQVAAAHGLGAPYMPAPAAAAAPERPRSGTSVAGEQAAAAERRASAGSAAAPAVLLAQRPRS